MDKAHEPRESESASALTLLQHTSQAEVTVRDLTRRSTATA
jgi:hypothetical protein